MENGPKLDGGKKMAKKWPKNGKILENSLKSPFFGHVFPIFAPVQLGALFPFDFHFFVFSISGFWPFSMPYQPGRIPKKRERERGFREGFLARVLRWWF